MANIAEVGSWLGRWDLGRAADGWGVTQVERFLVGTNEARPLVHQSLTGYLGYDQTTVLRGVPLHNA
jgi:hypothetical protein